MSTPTLATLLVSTTLVAAAPEPRAQEAPAQVELALDEPTGASNARTYLVIGLSTAAVIGLLLLIVLLARSGGDEAPPRTR